MTTPNPPPVTSKRPLAELRALGLKPFAVWSYELGAYLDIPTTWAIYPAAAIQQMARRRDRGCTFTDRHGRKPGRSTRDQRVVWSSGMDTGLLRADAQPYPEACAACGAAVHAGACPVDSPPDGTAEPAPTTESVQRMRAKSGR